MTSTCAHVTEPHSSLLAGIYKSGSPGSIGYQVLLSRYSLMVAGRCAPFTPSSSSFPYSAGPSTKSCTGLMEWADQEAVLDVFVLTNHQTIYSQSMPSSFSSLLVQHMHTSHSLWSSSSLLLLLLLLFLLFLLFLSLSLSRWSGLHVQDGLL